MARYPAEDIIILIDNGTGEQAFCEWARAEEVIRANYRDADGVLRRLALGHPIRCEFATYQHRDFVPPGGMDDRGRREEHE
jgi:hypothetical protein